MRVRGTFEVEPNRSRLIEKQTSQQFRVFFIPTARRSHLFLAGVSAHGIKAIGNMHYVFSVHRITLIVDRGLRREKPNSMLGITLSMTRLIRYAIETKKKKLIESLA